MRIDTIEIFHVAMPLIYPWRTAYGEDAAIDSVLVRMRSGDLEAWSETTPFAAPQYSPEWARGVFHCVREWLAPSLIGRDIESGEELQQILSFVKGNPFAKGSLDIGWWILKALEEGQPLYRLLGGNRPEIDVGADFGIMDSIDDLLRGLEGAVDAGFKRVKLKFRPGWDLEMLRQVRGRFPSETFHVDCNSGYQLSDVDMFRRIDEFGLAMIEQPLAHDDLLDHAKLQKEIQTPVCLDESITTLEKARKAIELGSCRYVNVKPARVGGLTIAKQIHDLCREKGIPCWIGSMLESAIGTRANAAMATLGNFTYPADLFPTSRFYHQDLGSPHVELFQEDDGPKIVLLDRPGTGTEPDREMLERCSLSRALVNCPLQS